MLNTPIGIDTLEINPKEWRLEPHFATIVQPAAFHSSDGHREGDFLLYTLNGQRFSGAKAYLNLKSCKLEFHPFCDPKGRSSRVSTKITITVPRVIGPDNYHPADQEQLVEALGIAHAELAQHGFHFDIGIAAVKRLDASRTFQTCDQWTAYLPVLALLNASRMKGAAYPTGQRWGNSRCELVLYEKGIELASRYKKCLRAEVYARYPENSIRAEIRWTERDAVEEATGISTVRQLVNNFEAVERAFRRQFEKRLFRHTAGEFHRLHGSGMSVAEIAAEMQQGFAKNNARNNRWLQEWIHRDWVRNLTVERLETIKAAVRQVTADNNLARQNVMKKLQRLDESYLRYAQPLNEARSIADLYSELRDKVLAEESAAMEESAETEDNSATKGGPLVEDEAG